MSAPLVQKSTIASGATSASPSLTGTTATNLLVLCVAWDGTANTPATPAGWSVGNVVTPDSLGLTGAAVFYILSAAGGTISPTVTVTGAGDVYAQISEYASGAAWVFGAGLGANNGTTGVTSIVSSTLTPPQANSLVVSTWSGSGASNSDTLNPTTTGPAIVQLGVNLTGATTMDFEDQYQVTTTTTTFTDTWSTSPASMDMAWSVATFKYTPLSGDTLMGQAWM